MINKNFLVNDIFIGKLDAFEEELKNPKFFDSVYVDFADILDIIKNKVLICGPKGSGKSCIYLYIQKQYRKFQSQRESPDNVEIDKNVWNEDFLKDSLVIFIDLNHIVNRDLKGYDNCFLQLSDDIYANYMNHTPELKQHAQIPKEYYSAAIIKNTWSYVILVSLLREVESYLRHRISVTYEKSEKKRLKKINWQLNDHYDLYNIRTSGKILGILKKLKNRWLGRHIKVSMTLPESIPSPNVRVVKDEMATLNHSLYFDEAIKVVKELDLKLFVFFDNLDLILPAEREEITINFLSYLFEELPYLSTNYKNVFYKIVTRIDLPMRAIFSGKDKLINDYYVIRLEKKYLLIVILKRLLFHQEILEEVNKVIDISFSALQNATIEDLRKCFYLIFPEEKFRFNYVSVEVKNYLKESGIDNDGPINLDLLDYLYFFLKDGKGTVSLRHIISFIIRCLLCERLALKNTNINEPIEVDYMISKKSVLIALNAISEEIYNQLNNEYYFISKHFNILRDFVDNSIIERKEIETKMKLEYQESYLHVLTGLFYSGIIGGDSRVLEDCKTFFLPVFVQSSLKMNKVNE